ncbi:MAG: hypothetical protein AAGF56_14240, partial [Pseudomonadota bacterium]
IGASRPAKVIVSWLVELGMVELDMVEDCSFSEASWSSLACDADDLAARKRSVRHGALILQPANGVPGSAGRSDTDQIGGIAG